MLLLAHVRRSSFPHHDDVLRAPAPVNNVVNEAEVFSPVSLHIALGDASLTVDYLPIHVKARVAVMSQLLEAKPAAVVSVQPFLYRLENVGQCLAVGLIMAATVAVAQVPTIGDELPLTRRRDDEAPGFHDSVELGEPTLMHILRQVGEDRVAVDEVEGVGGERRGRQGIAELELTPAIGALAEFDRPGVRVDAEDVHWRQIAEEE